jgi:periplasmic divalent cation tolerance protein
MEVHVTLPDAQQAASLARALVDERLAACVNVVAGVRSVYRWQGQIQEDDEALCLIKTRPELLSALERRILELHPYEVPEILAFAADDGSPSYLAWLRDSTPAPAPTGK